MADLHIEQGYNSPDVIRSYDTPRLVFERLVSHTVDQVLKEYQTNPQHTLDIGSGLGELKRLIDRTGSHPELVSNLYEVERWIDVAKENRQVGNQPKRISVATTNELPFNSKTFHTVLGLSVLDSFNNLEIALEDIHRILVPRGKLIHFQDLHPSHERVIAKYRSGNIFPFPNFSEGKERFILGDRSKVPPARDWNKFLMAMDMASSQLPISDFLQDSLNTYRLLNREPGLEILKGLGVFLRSLFRNAMVGSIEPREDFEKELVEALPRHRFKIVEFQERSQIEISIPEEFELITNEPGNHLYNTVGDITVTNEPHLANSHGPNFRLITCRTQVLVAEKLK